MGWHQFKYVFDKTVENAMLYSIREALRRHRSGDSSDDDIARDALEAFKRKMDKHTGAKK